MIVPIRDLVELHRGGDIRELEAPRRTTAVVPAMARCRAQVGRTNPGGSDAGAGELLRISGPLSVHAHSVVCCRSAAGHTGGRMVAWRVPCCAGRRSRWAGWPSRRITDATASEDRLLPSEPLDGYTDGDTDLAWSRITYWRALLASAVDQPPYETDHVRRGFRPERRTCTDILAGWLACRIDGPLQRAVGELEGRIESSVRDGGAEPPAGRGHRDPEPHITAEGLGSVAAQGRLGTVLAEDMRRLDPDEIYHRRRSRALRRCGTSDRGSRNLR